MIRCRGTKIMSNRKRSNPAFLEALALAGTILLLVALLKDMLILGRSTMAHDNLYWNYPMYHFFADSLIGGRLPLWDPFNNGGVPFYPMVLLGSYLEPVALFTTVFLSEFTSDTLILFHWTRFLLSVTSLVGAYCVLRLFCRSLTARLALLPPLFLSYMMLGSFAQPSLIQLFAWTPWTLYFFLRIVHFKDYRVANWCLLAATLGINFQSYYFAAPWLMLLAFFAAFLMFEREAIKGLFRHRGNRLGAALLALTCAVMALPNYSVWRDQADLVYPARLTDPSANKSLAQTEGAPETVTSGLELSYRTLTQTGISATCWSLFQSVIPDRAFEMFAMMENRWRGAHDGHGYFGLLFFFVSLVGILYGNAPLKRVWFGVFIAFLLIIFGPSGMLHRLVFAVFPPLWYLRNVFFLIPFVWLGAIYFFAIGVDRIVANSRLSPLTFEVSLGLVASTFAATAVIGVVALEKQSPELTPLVLATTALLVFLLRRHRMFLLLALGLGAGIAAVVESLNTTACLFHFLWSVGLPLGLFAFLRKHRQWIAPLVVSIVALDLTLSFRANHFLYDAHRHPADVLKIDSHARPPELPKPRQIAPAFPKHPADQQAMRMLGVLYRQPYALSTVKKGSAETFSEALKATRWNSFYLPKPYFDLVHSKLDPKVMADAFRIGRSPLDFIEGQAEGKILSYDYNTLAVELTAKTPGKLYWADGYHRYWNAYIDGKRVDLERSRGAFKAVAFPEGTHRLSFRFEPWPFVMACLLYYFALAAVLLGAGAANLSQFAKLLLNRYSKTRFRRFQTLPEGASTF